MLSRPALVVLLVFSASAAAQTPDEVATAAIAATLDTPAYTYRFAIRVETPDTLITEGGTATTRVDTTAGVALFRLDLADQTLAFDGGAFRVRDRRMRKVYVDSTLSEMGESIAAVIGYHPTIGTMLLNLHNGASELTDGGRDAVGGAPCRRLTYSREPLDIPGPQIAVCYDDDLRLPSQVVIRGTGRDGVPSVIEIIYEGVRAVPVPADTVFSLPATDGYTEVPYDQSGEPLLAVGTEAPPFALTTASGDPVRLADYRGRPVLIDFWGTWCAPCVAALPEIQALHEAYPELVVLGLASFEDADIDPGAFAWRRGATYPVVRAPTDLVEAYLVYAFPTYYLIGPDGDVRFTAVHDSNPDAEADVRAAVGVLLGAPR